MSGCCTNDCPYCRVVNLTVTNALAVDSATALRTGATTGGALVVSSSVAQTSGSLVAIDGVAGQVALEVAAGDVELDGGALRSAADLEIDVPAGYTIEVGAGTTASVNVGHTNTANVSVEAQTVTLISGGQIAFQAGTTCDLYASGDLTLESDGTVALVAGTSTVSGALTVAGGATFTAESTHNGGIDVNGAADVSGTLTVAGTVTVGGVASVGQLSFGGVTFTLPGGDGTAGQVLQTDGSATLSWATAGGGGGGAGSLGSLTDCLAENNSLWIGNAPGSTSTASYNLAVGATALDAITTGDNNTAIGHDALTAHATGVDNTAVGFEALQANDGTNSNTAVGARALKASATGYYNTACGADALASSSSAWSNTAIGALALTSCVSNGYNTAVGHEALKAQTGSSSTAVGRGALVLCTGNTNVALGDQAGNNVSTGYDNVYLGADSLASNGGAAHNEIAIGYDAVGQGDNSVQIGDANITSAHIAVSWTTSSDARIKHSVEDFALGLDFVRSLRPVRFQMLNPADYPPELRHPRFDGPTARPPDNEAVYDGLIAQEVAAALQARGATWSGHHTKPNGGQGIQYAMLVVPLINATKELHDATVALEADVAQLEARADDVEQRLSALESAG